MNSYFNTRHLAVGYDGTVLIEDINIEIEKGKILTLIGPNGAGKSTILKTLTRHLKRLGGGISIENQEIEKWSAKQMAKQVAVAFTGHARPELLTCAEVVAMGRYPYTDMLGRLTEEDEQIIHASMERVHALDLAERDFSTLSDGQKQRIVLARAICQRPKIIVLDEPTAFLDIRYKVELLEILRTMAREEQITVIMSLHEIDLAAKISDYLICVKGKHIAQFGTPEEILEHGSMEALYDMESGSYDQLFGSVELGKCAGEPQVFVVAGGGYGIPCYRALQKQGIPFATGILFENDVDHRVAEHLSDHVVTAAAFEVMDQALYEEALELMGRCKVVMDAGTPVGTLNRQNGELLKFARQRGIPVLAAADIQELFKVEMGGKNENAKAPICRD